MLVLLTFVLAFLMPSSGQRLTKEECARPRACTRELDYMCGSDGVSYGNPCLFRFAQCDNPKLFLHAIGPCEDPLVLCPLSCGYSYAPVCGSDGITYANDCEFRKAKCRTPSLSIVKANGACEAETPPHEEDRHDDCPAACIALWDPVCGTDGKTYGNSCELAMAKCKQGSTSTLAILHKGECTDKKVHERIAGHDSL